METDTNNITNTTQSNSTKKDDPKNVAVDSDNKTLPGPKTPKWKMEEPKQANGNKNYAHKPYTGLTATCRNYDNKRRHVERSPHRTLYYPTKTTKAKEKIEKSLPPQAKSDLFSMTVPDKTLKKTNITLHDSKNTSKEKLDVPNDTKLSSTTPGNHTKPLHQQPDLNSKSLSNPRPAGQFLQPTGQFPRQSGQFSYSSGQFPCPSVEYPISSGHPYPFVRFSRPAGQFPGPVGQLPQNEIKKDVVVEVHPPLPPQSDLNSKSLPAKTNESPKIVLTPDSKNKSKGVLQSPYGAKLSSKIPDNQIEPQVQHPDLNSDALSNGPQHSPNLSGQFPHAIGQFPGPAGQFPHATRQFPQPTEQFTRPTVQFIRPSEQFPQPTGQFARPSGQFIRPPGQFPQPTGQFTRPSGQFIRPPRHFPHPTGQFSHPTNTFPQPTGQFPQPTGFHHPTGHFSYHRSRFPYPSIRSLFSPGQSHASGQSYYRNNTFINTPRQQYHNGQFLPVPLPIGKFSQIPGQNRNLPRQFPHLPGQFQHVSRPVHTSAQFSYVPLQFPSPNGSFPLAGRYSQPNVGFSRNMGQFQQFAQHGQNQRMPRPERLPQAEFAHPVKLFQQPIVRLPDSYSQFQNSPGQFVQPFAPYPHYHYSHTEQPLQPHLPIQVVPKGPMILVIDITEASEVVPDEKIVIHGEVLEVNLDGLNSGSKDSNEKTSLDKNNLNRSEHVKHFADLPVPKHKGRLIPIRSEEVAHQVNDCTNQNKTPDSVQCSNEDTEITNLETKDEKNLESTVENMPSDQETDFNRLISVTTIKATSDDDTKFLIINESNLPNSNNIDIDLNEQFQINLDVELSSELETLSYNLSDLNAEMSTDLDESQSLDIDFQESSNDEEMSATDQPLPKYEIQPTCKLPLNNNEHMTCQSIYLPSSIREELLPQPKGFLQTNSDVESSDLKVKAPTGFDETAAKCFDEKFVSLGINTPPDIEKEAPLYTDLRKLLKLYEKEDERPNGQLPLYLR